MKDISTKKYGRLTPIETTSDRVKKSIVWKCLCDCGNICYTPSSYLEKGKKLSCGCLLAEIREKPAALNSLYKSYRYHANKRDYNFELSLEQFQNIISKNCDYCNASPTQKVTNKPKTKVLLYNGIDRKDNKVGYIENNCVPCCGECNYIKSDKLTYNEMKVAIKAIIEYRNSLHGDDRHNY